MTCRELTEFIADYVAGALSDEVRGAFEYHLGRCPNCVNYLTSYQSTIALGRGAFAAGDRDVPADVPEDLVRAILAARKPS
jgi:anti-sigma factor RsiW